MNHLVQVVILVNKPASDPFSRSPCSSLLGSKQVFSIGFIIIRFVVWNRIVVRVRLRVAAATNLAHLNAGAGRLGELFLTRLGTVAALIFGVCRGLTILLEVHHVSTMRSGKSAVRHIVRGSPNESLRSMRSRIASLSGTAHRNARRADGGNASRFSGKAKSKRQPVRSHTLKPIPADLAQFGIEIGETILGSRLIVVMFR